MRPVAYKINGNTVTFTPAEQKENHLQMQIAVTLADGTSKVTVSHTITNTGGTPVTCAAWALSVMAKGGLCAVEQTSRDTGLLHNRAVCALALREDERPARTLGRTLHHTPAGGRAPIAV